MKLLFTPTRFYPRVGGIEEVCLQECTELAKRGHEVTVVCADEPKTGDLSFRGIVIKRLQVFATWSNTPLTNGFFRVSRAVEPDVIHTNIPHPWSSDLSALFSFFAGVPLTVMYQNDTVGKGFWSFPIKIYNTFFVSAILRRAAKIMVLSEALRDRSVILRPFLNKVIVTPPGVRSELFECVPRTRTDAVHILFVSRLDKEHWYKGFDVLVAALAATDPSFRYRLTVVGDGPDRDLFEEQSRCLGDCVVFAGRVSDLDFPAVYGSCDFLVLPSVCGKAEGFGLVAIEAMAAGKPVIVSDVVAVSEAVRKHGLGEVVPAKDAAALRAAIVRLASAPVYDSERSRSFVKAHYLWSKHVDVLEHVWADILSGQSSGVT